MTGTEFVKIYPYLYHMATADALPQIQKYGLLSTQAMLDLLNIQGEERETLTAKRRPKTVVLTHPLHGRFVIRDQIPLRDAALEKCLTGMPIADWHRTLNERVFMWATKKRVETLLAARAYRSKPHLVLVIDSKQLLAAHELELALCSINSGATLYTPPARGPKTFCALADYESLNPNKPVVEVTVPGSIPNLKDFIVDATVRKAQS